MVKPRVVVITLSLGLAVGGCAAKHKHVANPATGPSDAAGWSFVSDPHLGDPVGANSRLAVLHDTTFAHAASVEWGLVAVNDRDREIEISATVDGGCATFRGVTVTETSSNVTVGAYVADQSLPASSGQPTPSVPCSAGLSVAVEIGVVQLDAPLAARRLDHAPVTTTR